MHLLIPYVHLRHHADPMLSEFTYGDVRGRARKLKASLQKGDYVFFHTGMDGKKYITAYYVVDRVLDTVDACKDKAITVKYRNPHIVEFLAMKRPVYGDDAIVFGDPITSHILDKPLLFGRKLSDRLSLNIKFSPTRQETQTIASSTRAWRTLTDKDVETLLREIESEREGIHPCLARSTEEVAETIEKDVEDHIARNPKLIGKGLTLAERQLIIESGRVDLLLEDQTGNLTVVEVKFNKIGREALKQVQRYIHELKATAPGKKVTGVIVCAGVMPAYEIDLRKQKDIRILVYGWEMQVSQW